MLLKISSNNYFILQGFHFYINFSIQSFDSALIVHEKKVTSREKTKKKTTNMRENQLRGIEKRGRDKIRLRFHQY